MSKEKRFFVIFLGVIFAFLILSGRSFFLQMVEGEKWTRLSRENCVRPIIIKAPRGIIYDRNGKELVSNRPAYSIIAQDESSLIRIEELLDSPITGLKKERNPLTVRDAPFELICKIEERKNEFPGINVSAEPLRKYLLPEILSHPIGYVGEVSRQELGKYKLGDFIGRMGIEKKYESYLVGKDGVMYMEVDAKGNEIRPLEEARFVPPQPGANLWLTIDVDLQELAYESLNDYERGAIVAVNPKNGEILVYLSKPGFDVNTLSWGAPSAYWENLKNDPRAPLWDRVKNGRYPPGSVFKLVTTIAGLEEGIIKRSSYMELACTGKIKIGNRIYNCWEKHGHLDLVNAIVHSCDVYFYQLGMKIGVDKLATYAKKLGFGERTRIDLSGESEGFIPTKSWYGKRLTRGVIANLSIGQGEILATPIQLLNLGLIIANDGVLFRPHVVKSIVLPNGETISPTIRRKTARINKQTLDIIKEAMFGVVNYVKGTGGLARIIGVKVAGKTGTAENPHGEDHASFLGFAPVEDPEICVVAVIENGGKGGSVAAPIVGKIIKEYFKLKTERGLVSKGDAIQEPVNAM